MGYVGNQTTTSFTSMDKQTITGSGATTYTLSHNVSSESEIEVFVNNIRQEGGSGKAYTVSANQITFSEAVASSDSIYVIFQGKAIQTVVPPDGSVSTAKLASGAVAHSTLPTGSVLQVLNSTLTGAASTSGTSFADTGLTVTITPKSTSNKILIMVNLGLVGFSGTSDGAVFNLDRSGTTIGASTGAGTLNTFMQSFSQSADIFSGLSNHFLDSPSSTSSLVYKLQWKATGSNNTLYINRRGADNYARAMSSMTLMEIVG